MKHYFNRQHYPDEMEELYKGAKDIVITNGKCQTSMLQRKLKIGYFKTLELVDMLEERGIVGKSNGAKPRELLSP